MSDPSKSIIGQSIRTVADQGDPWAKAMLLAEENDRLRGVLAQAVEAFDDHANRHSEQHLRELVDDFREAATRALGGQR